MEKSIHTREYAVLLRLLKQAREAAGLTQVQVARRLKQSQSFVTKMERGGPPDRRGATADHLPAVRLDPDRVRGAARGRTGLGVSTTPRRKRLTFRGERAANGRPTPGINSGHFSQLTFSFSVDGGTLNT